ncbi:MAG TPA: XRE family transcriptional regulator, partial [Mycobacterium sp.]|nr:XRE family transcriptional regulator [Mycobacterium sp.]
MTVSSEVRGTDRDESSERNGGPAVPCDRPVEFWPTAAIRAALENDDLSVWQRIVVAIKRDPFGRTARQVEEVLETAEPYGVSRAMSEVLVRTREHLEVN